MVVYNITNGYLTDEAKNYKLKLEGMNQVQIFNLIKEKVDDYHGVRDAEFKFDLYGMVKFNKLKMEVIDYLIDTISEMITNNIKKNLKQIAMTVFILSFNDYNEYEDCLSDI